jgi:hypothetical protein
MGLSITVDFKTDKAERIEALMIKPREINAVIARNVSNVITNYLYTYDRSHPNKLGGKRTHLVSDMAKSTLFESDEQSARINIYHEAARQRIEGGTIKPVNGPKYLTLAAISEAYGKRAREWNNLEILYSKRNGQVTPVALVGTRSTPVGRGAPKRKGRIKPISKTSGRVVYWLVKSVTQNPNPNLLPGEDKILEASIRAVDALFNARMNQ